MSPRYSPWRRRLNTIEERGQTRILRTLHPTGPTTGRLDGRDVLVACSNDYLGLAWHPDVRGAAKGAGTASSRLISGDRPIHRALEAELEDWLGRPATLFSSGWHANTGALPAMFFADDLVASDELNHASIIDGLRLSRAERTVVPHAQADAVPAHARAIIVEGLFSMDGDVPPLRAYPTAPWMIVDEAHSIGCLGPDGRGACAAAGVQPDVLIGTFGKALGAYGAFVVGPPELRELLINTARSFIYTTALAEPIAAMALAGLRIARQQPDRRDRLATNATRLRAGLRQLGWRPLGQHHIVPVVVGPQVMSIDERLHAAGVFAAGIRHPTVARGSERVRFTVSSEHTSDQIDQILEAMGPAR